MAFDKFITLPILILFVIIINIIGKIILSICNIKSEKQYFRIFLEQLLGLTLIVVLYSIYQTKGKTINVFFVFIPIYYYFFLKRPQQTFCNKIKIFDILYFIRKDLIILFFLCLPFYFLQVYSLFSLSGYIIPHIDSLYYSEIINTLNYFGIEKKEFAFNILLPNTFNGIEPYHYYELWVAAFASKIFNQAAIYSLLLITYPILSSIVFIGLVAIWENFSKITIWTYLIVSLLLFTDGAYVAYLNNIPIVGGYVFWTSILSILGYKYVTSYIFILFFLLLYIKEKKEFAFISLACLMIVSIGITPGLFVGIIGFLLLNKYHTTFIEKEKLRILTFYILYSISYFLFYWGLNHFSNSLNHITENGTSIVFSDFFNLKHIKYVYGMMMYRFIRCLILYIPYIISVFILYRTVIKKNNTIIQLIILVMLINIAGLASYGCMVNNLNSAQLFINTFTLTTFLINFILIFGIIQLFQLRNIYFKKTLWGALSIVIIINIMNVFNIYLFNKTELKVEYSKEYIKTVLSEIDTKSTILYGGFYSAKDQRFYSIIKPGRFILFSEGYKNIINLNSYNLFQNCTLLDKPSISLLKQSEFYLFVKDQIQKQKFKSYEKSQIDFIDKFHISYIFVSKGVYISSNLKLRLKLIILDSLTGEQFYKVLIPRIDNSFNCN